MKFRSKFLTRKQGYFSTLSPTVPCQCGAGGCFFDGETYQCGLCRRFVPVCFGAGDRWFPYCDDCADYLQTLTEEVF